MDVRVQLLAMLEEGDTGVPVLLLHDAEHDRVLPIWIGVPEAQAIAIAHGRLSTERPLSHQLFVRVLKSFSVSIKGVKISKIDGGTFFAELLLSLGDRNSTFDARPSDAVALALHYDAPIFVDESVMRMSSFPNPFARTRSSITRQEMSTEEIERLKNLLTNARLREESKS